MATVPRLTLIGIALLFPLVADIAAADQPGQPDTAHQAPVSELWDHYFSSREAGDQAGALALALSLQDRALQQHGAGSDAYAIALAEVGISRLLLNDYGQAFADLTTAEDLLSEELSIYNEKLIRALTFLGSALQSSGKLEQALDAYSRAQHITHRLWGTENPAQIPLAYAKAETFQALGNLPSAKQQIALGWKLNRAVHGVASSHAIDGAARYGTWLRSVGDYDGAIAVFHDALSELQGSGPDQPQALPLLRGMAHAYRGGYRGKFARGMYERIVAMMEREPEAFSVDHRVELRLAFGDWLMQRYFEGKAVDQYEAAWTIANAAGPDGAHWLPQFAQPQLVRYGEMAPRDLGGEDRQVTFQFRLTDDGRVRGAKVVDASADSRDSSRARQNFPNLTRYRPAIVEGQAQPMAMMTATMYLLPDGLALEPAPVAAPARLTSRNAVATSNWTMLRGDQAMTLNVAQENRQ